MNMGALANVSDVLVGLNPGDVQLRTENTSTSEEKDFIGHSQIVDNNDNVLVDWGPQEQLYKDNPLKSVPGTNRYTPEGPIPDYEMKWAPVTIKGVNMNRILNWSPKGNYNLLYNNCVNQASRALNMSGVLNIGIHPYFLHLQMYLRAMGVRPLLYSYILTINR